MRRACANFACGFALVLALTLVGGAPAGADGPIVLPVPHIFAGFTVNPTPMPSRKEGRIPTSLRLTDTIWTDDDSRPPAMEELRFQLDSRLRLDLSGVPRCLWAPLQAYPAFDWDSCEKAEVATGPIRVEVALAEQEPVKLSAPATAYNGRPGTMLIHAQFADPVSGELVVPVKLSRADGGVYGVTLTASFPKVANGSGSLIYLGLRFRRGIFSVACTKRSFQSWVSHTFVGGTEASETFRSDC